MFKKLFYIFLAAAAACFLLPLCFGLWSEGLTVGAHIIMAPPEPSVSAFFEPAAAPEPEQMTMPDDAEESSEPDVEAGTDDGQSDSEGGETGISQETPAPAETETQPEDGGGEDDDAPGAGSAE